MRPPPHDDVTAPGIDHEAISPGLALRNEAHEADVAATIWWPACVPHTAAG